MGVEDHYQVYVPRKLTDVSGQIPVRSAGPVLNKSMTGRREKNRPHQKGSSQQGEPRFRREGQEGGAQPRWAPKNACCRPRRWWAAQCGCGRCLLSGCGTLVASPARACLSLQTGEAHSGLGRTTMTTMVRTPSLVPPHHMHHAPLRRTLPRLIAKRQRSSSQGVIEAQLLDVRRPDTAISIVRRSAFSLFHRNSSVCTSWRCLIILFRALTFYSL